MDLKRLPPSLLVALGLAATGADAPGCTTGACLDVAGPETTGSLCLSAPFPETTTGPCLDVGPLGSSGSGFETGSTVGPCLDVAPGTTTTGTPTTGTGSSSGTDTDTDTDTDTGTLIATPAVWP